MKTPYTLNVYLLNYEKSILITQRLNVAIITFCDIMDSLISIPLFSLQFLYFLYNLEIITFLYCIRGIYRTFSIKKFIDYTESVSLGRKLLSFTYMYVCTNLIKFDILSRQWKAIPFLKQWETHVPHTFVHIARSNTQSITDNNLNCLIVAYTYCAMRLLFFVPIQIR